MDKKKLLELKAKYKLPEEDSFAHKHYEIITRQGIDKIQAVEKIFIDYTSVKCDPEFCVVKASAQKGTVKIQTFGSAKYGGKEWNKTKNNNKGGWDEHGNTSTWYVMEMAEKRAMSRAVLKLTGFYELGVFGEDESEDFKKTQKDPVEESFKIAFSNCKVLKDVQLIWTSNNHLQKNEWFVNLKDKRKNELSK